MPAFLGGRRWGFLKEFIRVEGFEKRGLGDTDRQSSLCGANTELAEQPFPWRRGRGASDTLERRKNKGKNSGAVSQKAKTKARGSLFPAPVNVHF
jgi:hypothetical protein